MTGQDETASTASSYASSPKQTYGFALGVLQLFLGRSGEGCQDVFANIGVAPMNTILFLVNSMSYSEGHQDTVMQHSRLAACKEIATNLLMSLESQMRNSSTAAIGKRDFPEWYLLFSTEET